MNPNSLFFALPVALMLLVSCRNNTSDNRVEMELSGNWEFKSTDDSVWMPATVPGCVHTDLMDNGIIKDPFYRLNEHEVQWVDKKDWEYRINFTIKKSTYNKDHIELLFEGLDTYADVYLNDKLILSADNMFIRYRVDCKEYLINGTNSLHIILRSPVLKGLEKYNQLDYVIPVSDNDLSEIGGMGDYKVSIFTRKAGYHFGWDWGPRLVTSGIWKPVSLVGWNKSVIRDVWFSDERFRGEKVQFSLNTELESDTDFTGNILVYIDDKLVSDDKLEIKKGLNDYRIPLEMNPVDRWWPNGLGEQNLYNLQLVLSDRNWILDRKSQLKGFRTIEVSQEPDTTGRKFQFLVNGLPVFMKGANYIPQDVFLNRVKDSDYERIIKSAAESNMNMLRVWGGGIYEKNIFYDLCDQYGILVWQDFMFACAMFPGDEKFLQNVQKEAQDNILRLRNHPSIAMWCGNNEILAAWYSWGWKNKVTETYGTGIADTIWTAYKDIFHNILPETIKELDPDRFYWSSSPSAGQGVPENWKSGDTHYWGVWWGKEPFEQYETLIPRFMSEFGFQSFPDIRSVKKYSIPSDWDINSDVMRSHQRSSIGNVTIEEYMLRDFRKPKDFAMFLYVNHLLQARGIRMGIEAHRRNMPYCMGSLYWQMDDCWPVASWSSIDYYGNWKALQYAVKDAFAPIIVSCEKDADRVNFYIISDRTSNLDAVLKIRVLTFNGNEVFSEEKRISVLKNSSKNYMVQDIPVLLNGKNENEVVLAISLENENGKIITKSLYYLASPKQLQLPAPNLQTSVNREIEGWRILLTSDVLARNIYLQSADGGHFTNNYFDLLPGDTAEVYFVTDNPESIDTFRKNLQIVTLVDSYE